MAQQVNQPKLELGKNCNSQANKQQENLHSSKTYPNRQYRQKTQLWCAFIGWEENSINILLIYYCLT